MFTPLPPISDNLKCYGLERSAPSLFGALKLNGHQIVSVKSVNETALTIQTKCEMKPLFNSDSGTACLEITEQGLRLLYANFEKTADKSHVKLESQQYQEIFISDIEAAASEANQRYEQEKINRTAEEIGGGCITDTPHEQLKARILKETMNELLVKVRKNIKI